MGILTEETFIELVTLVAKEIDNLAGEVNGGPTAINAEPTDVEGRLEELYKAQVTKQFPIMGLSPTLCPEGPQEPVDGSAGGQPRASWSSGGWSYQTTEETREYVEDFREFL